MTTNCPECDGSITMDDVIKGEIVVCPDCGVELEVLEIQPSFELAMAPQEAEDWGE